MSITLTEEQSETLEKLYKFITTDEHDMALLEGCAGSGKTTLIQSLVRKLVDNAMLANIAMVAPTHKAVKVMKEMCDDDIREKIGFSSLHSLLGLKHQITADGKEIFVRDNRSISKLFLYDVIIVDEASMVADQLFNEIVDQNYKHVKILFVGDSNQINPVNHSHAIPMLATKRAEFKIDHFRLTKVIRQAEGSPIIQVSQQILNDKFHYKSGEKLINEEQESGVVMVSNNQSAVIQQLLQYYFCSEEFDKDADFCRVIAWRNKIVDEFNTVIRQLKYGRNVGKIVDGEKLIVDRPIKYDQADEIKFTTNEDLVVKSFTIEEKNLFGKTYKYYNTLVKGDLITETIHILHESSEKLYKITLAAFAETAKKEKDNFKRVSAWKNYFSFMENFASVNYGYAQTIHTSQGSTYDNCFVYYNDILVNRNSNERKRILYTAVTRPKKMLYIM
jgi:exodeoxyribonuclease-5